MTEWMVEILECQGINPDTLVNTDTGERTALEVLESAILGAVEEIEEGSD